MKYRAHNSKTIPSDGKMASIMGYIQGHQNTRIATLSKSEAGIGALKDMKIKLDLAGDELLRMENESGAPLNARQVAKAYAYYRESQSIEKVLLLAENTPAVRM